MTLIHFYKIINDKSNKIYIGSTKRNLNIRFSEHKSRYIRCKKLGCTKQRGNYMSHKIFEEDFETTKIKLIESYECKNKSERNKKENLYIDKYISECVNKAIPGQTCALWYIKNKDKIKMIRSKKVKCICGLEYTGYTRSKHFKNEKHNKRIKAAKIILSFLKKFSS